MSFPILILVVVFLVLLVLNVPVAFCMGIAAMVSIMAMGDLPAFVAMAHKIATGIDSFALLAIPFFILSGLLMDHGGIARRLIDFANVIVGRFRGGLALVNILTCMLFGSISGSSAAAVSSVGGFMIPLMNKRGYENNFNTAVTITAATTGLLIPPSNIMIVYSLATGGIVSIAAIFMAGVLPGILVGFGLMVVAAVISIRNHFGIIMIMNLCIGLCTPPVGTCLFLGCGIANTTVTRIIPRILPFFVAMIVTLMICTYIPELSLAAGCSGFVKVDEMA